MGTKHHSSVISMRHMAAISIELQNFLGWKGP